MLPTPPEGLRHWRLDDAPALAAAWADPAITRWNQPPDGLDPGRWIAGVEVRWTRRLALDLVICPRDDVAGEVGLSSFRREPARAELGVWVGSDHRRSGLGASAVQTLTRWALDADGLALHQLWARTDPANHPAEALFAHLGWERLGTADGMSIWSVTTSVLR